MTKPWTIERLRTLTSPQLQTLYGNARDTNSPEADEIIELIFQHKLLDSMGGGLPRHHPVIHAIEQVCRSERGKSAARAAMLKGEAPIAGVDPILQVEVREYGYADTTSWAGTFVADEMEAAGHLRSGRKSLPSGCVAKSAAFFVEGTNSR